MDATGIKRRLEVCRDCHRMMKVTRDGSDSVIGCFCCNVGVEPDIHLLLERKGFCSYGGNTPDSIVVKSNKWEELDIPSDCAMMSEYLVSEWNNEEKA